MTTWNALLGSGVSLLGDSSARPTYSHSRDHGTGGIARSGRQRRAFSNALWHRNVPGTPRLDVLQPDLRWLREARPERTCPLLPRQPALHPRRLNPRNLRALAGAGEVDHPDREHLADSSGVPASTLACVSRKRSATRAESSSLIWLDYQRPSKSRPLPGPVFGSVRARGGRAEPAALDLGVTRTSSATRLRRPRREAEGDRRRAVLLLAEQDRLVASQSLPRTRSHHPGGLRGPARRMSRWADRARPLTSHRLRPR